MIADAVPALLHSREQRYDLGLAQEVFAALWASVVRALLTFRPGTVFELDKRLARVFVRLVNRLKSGTKRGLARLDFFG
jgi:hypothetical protein